MTDSIIVLSDRDKVRQRPGMYIGDNAKLGLETIVREIFDNAVDEYPNYPDKTKPITVVLHSDNSVTVRDYGRGISPYESSKHPGKIEERLAYTLIGAGGKFEQNRDQNGNKFSGGLNGTGSSATNFMSEYFDVTIYRDGQVFHDRYEDGGKPVVKLVNGQLPHEKQEKPFTTGTEITFKADKRVLTTTHVDSDKLEQIFEQTAYLNPGLAIEFKNERDGDTDFTRYYSEKGLLGYIKKLTDEDEVSDDLLIKPFEVSGEAQAESLGHKVDMQAKIAFAFAKSDTGDSEAFTNGVYNNLGGTHLNGFYDGLLKLLRHYYDAFSDVMRQKYHRQIDLILKVNKAKDMTRLFNKREISPRTYVVLDFKHSNPILRPQTKDELTSPEAKKAVSDIFYTHAMHYFDRNVRAVQTILGYIIKDLYEKAKDDDADAKLSRKEQKLAVSTKLAAARDVGPGKDAELILVEGDSAAGSLKENRDADYQAILPLRGKILNVEKSTLSRALANQEIATIFSVLGAGYGKNYDDHKLQYDKVIICTDADVDGAHISVLLQTLFLKYLPGLMENGHVYRMITPLFVNTMKNGEEVYTYDDKEQEDFLAKHRNDLDEVNRNKGLGELTKKQVIETILTPETRHMQQIEINDEDSAYDTVDALMGTNVSERKKLFTSGEN
mgnify:FL=1